MYALVFPGHESLAASMGLEIIPWQWHEFPDQEFYVRIHVDVKIPDQICILCSLNNPDAKIIRLILASQALRKYGAKSITLLTPYLCYMRQDAVFQHGEGISCQVIGKLLSSYFDRIITIDAHLHRVKSLTEIFQSATLHLHAGPLLADYIKQSIANPLLIGPDQESEQWVASIAQLCHAPYVIATKTRHGDKNVSVNMPDLSSYTGCNPVLIDDVISTGQTLYQAALAIHHPQLTIMAVHGIFADNSYELLKSVSQSIVTTNSIPHETNKIDISLLINL